MRVSMLSALLLGHFWWIYAPRMPSRRITSRVQLISPLHGQIWLRIVSRINRPLSTSSVTIITSLGSESRDLRRWDSPMSIPVATWRSITSVLCDFSNRGKIKQPLVLLRAPKVVFISICTFNQNIFIINYLYIMILKYL